MKNKKGFTLVELLAVIVVLGIILSITTVSILNLKEKQDEENIKNTISSILTAAKEYNVEHRFSGSVSVDDLILEGYVEYDGEAKYKGNTYDSLLGGASVIKQSCGNLKVQYVFEKAIYNSVEDKDVKYNDCGCNLNQEVNVTEQSEKLCYE